MTGEVAEVATTERVNGKYTPGLAALLAMPDAPTYRQLDHWVRRGYLHPTRLAPLSDGGRARWRWPESERWVAVGIARLVRAGMTPEGAEPIARAARGEAIYLGAGVWAQLDANPASGEPEGVAFPCPQ